MHVVHVCAHGPTRQLSMLTMAMPYLSWLARQLWGQATMKWCSSGSASGHGVRVTLGQRAW